MDDVTAFPDGFVAVGYTYPGWTATSWASTDGRHWRLVPVSDEEATFPVAVAAGHRLIVAVGRRGTRPAAWTSSDGTGWEERAVATAGPGGEAQRMTAVAVTADGFVAGGSSGPELGERRARFWRSADGLTWQPIPDGPAMTDAEVTDIVAADGGLVAVGVLGPANRPTGSVAWTSSDGTAWTRVDAKALASGRAVSLVTAGDGAIIAVGSDLDEREAIAWRSEDGRDWRQAPREASRFLGGRKVRMTDVARSGDLLVAVGNHVGLQFGTASCWTSLDGLRWTRSTDTPPLEQWEMSAVVAEGPGLVSVGTFGAPDNYIPRVWLSPGPP
jgi:hypothetical protein